MNGIGDFVTSIKEVQRLAAQVVIELKGDAPGHPFRGNQWDGGSGGNESGDNSVNIDSAVESSSVSFGQNKKQNIEAAKKVAEGIGVRATTENPSGRKIDRGTIAIYNNQTGEIFINPHADYWKDPKAYAEKYFKSGQLSTSDPRGPIFHEAAHGKYKAPDNFADNFGHRAIADKVSRYARVNPKEFVSETYAGMMTGKKYSEDVVNLFNYYAR